MSRQRATTRPCLHAAQGHNKAARPATRPVVGLRYGKGAATTRPSARRAGPFSATDFVSRLFFIVLQVLGTSVIKLGFLLVLNVENSQRLHQAGMKKC